MESSDLVVGAVIVDSVTSPRCVLGARKSVGPDSGSWEFPGGKVEPGESAEDALRREIREELGVDIVVHDSLGDWPIRPGLVLRLLVAACDEPVVLGADHDEVRWFAVHHLHDVRWLPADEQALAAVADLLSARSDPHASA